MPSLILAIARANACRVTSFAIFDPDFGDGAAGEVEFSSSPCECPTKNAKRDAAIAENMSRPGEQ
jgi:hypothetical protein